MSAPPIDYTDITAQISKFLYNPVLCVPDTSSADLVLSTLLSIVHTTFSVAAQARNATHKASICTRLPAEMLLRVVSWLETDTRLAMTLVSKYFRGLLLDSSHTLNNAVEVRNGRDDWAVLLRRVTAGTPLRIYISAWPEAQSQQDFLVDKLRDAHVVDLLGNTWVTAETSLALPALQELHIRGSNAFRSGLSTLAPNLRVLRVEQVQFLQHPGVMSSLRVLSCRSLRGVDVNRIWETFPQLVELCIQHIDELAMLPSTIPQTMRRLYVGGAREFSGHTALWMDQTIARWTSHRLSDVTFWNTASLSAVLLLFSRCGSTKPWTLVCREISKTYMTSYTTTSERDRDIVRMVLHDNYVGLPSYIWREAFNALPSTTLQLLTALELVEQLFVSLIQADLTLPAVEDLLIVLSSKKEDSRERWYGQLSTAAPETQLHLPLMRNLVIRARRGLTKQSSALKFVHDDFPAVFASRVEFTTANVLVEWESAGSDRRHTELAGMEVAYRAIARAVESTVEVVTGALKRPPVVIDSDTPYLPRVENFAWVPAAFD